jgi:hypothetical protein
MKKCTLEINHNIAKDLSALAISPHEILMGYRNVVMTGEFNRTEIDEIIKLISSFSYGDIHKLNNSKDKKDKFSYGVWKKDRKGKNKKVVVKKLSSVGGVGGGGGNFNTAGTTNTK